MVANFCLGLMSDKLRSRVKIYSKMEEMTSVEKEILPKEYGGTVPMADMIGEFQRPSTIIINRNLIFSIK